jgi:nicotinamidase-related amidase
MTNTALVLIDIQNDYFENGQWPVHDMLRVAENSAKLLADAREKKMMVVHVRHEIPSDQAPFFRPGSKGAEIHPIVAPIEGEAIILKHKANSFQDTSLLELLKKSGIENLVICGAMSQMCIDATSRAASDFGYNVILVEDACGAKEQAFGAVSVAAPEVHAAFMAPLAMSYASIVTTESYVSTD